MVMVEVCLSLPGVVRPVGCRGWLAGGWGLGAGGVQEGDQGQEMRGGQGSVKRGVRYGGLRCSGRGGTPPNTAKLADKVGVALAKDIRLGEVPGAHDGYIDALQPVALPFLRWWWPFGGSRLLCFTRIRFLSAMCSTLSVLGSHVKRLSDQDILANLRTDPGGHLGLDFHTLLPRHLLSWKMP